jgi:hypothetical protein
VCVSRCGDACTCLNGSYTSISQHPVQLHITHPHTLKYRLRHVWASGQEYTKHLRINSDYWEISIPVDTAEAVGLRRQLERAAAVAVDAFNSHSAAEVCFMCGCCVVFVYVVDVCVCVCVCVLTHGYAPHPHCTHVPLYTHTKTLLYTIFYPLPPARTCTQIRVHRHTHTHTPVRIHTPPHKHGQTCVHTHHI